MIHKRSDLSRLNEDIFTATADLDRLRSNVKEIRAAAVLENDSIGTIKQRWDQLNKEIMIGEGTLNKTKRLISDEEDKMRRVQQTCADQIRQLEVQ